MNEFNLNSDTLSLVLRVADALQKDIPGEMVDLVNVIAYRVAGTWQNKAMEETWGTKYAKAIKVEPLTELSGYAQIYVDESEIDPGSKKPLAMFVQMIEGGVKPWSIKDALLQSKKVKTTSKGIRYIIVPFRWRTPKRQKSSSSMFAGVMSDDIYKEVKNGGRLSGDKEKYGYMAGLTKYEKGNHSQYRTFRMVTEKSQGWQHPGAAAKPVYQRVLATVEKQIEQMLTNYLAGYTKDLESRGINV